MRTAAEFREIAREVLRGKWKIAVIAGLVASLLGGISGSGPEVKLNIDVSHANVSFEYAGQTIISTSGGLNTAFIVGSGMYIALMAIALAAVYFILGSIIEIGYARFNLDLNYGYEPTIHKLFDYLHNWKTTSMARFLRSVYTLLWTFLFIIPGIMASYSYAMTGYILAEHPDMTSNRAFERDDAGKQMEIVLLAM